MNTLISLYIMNSSISTRNSKLVIAIICGVNLIKDVKNSLYIVELSIV